MWDRRSWLEVGFSSAHCLDCRCLKSFCERERERGRVRGGRQKKIVRKTGGVRGREIESEKIRLKVKEGAAET